MITNTSKKNNSYKKNDFTCDTEEDLEKIIQYGKQGSTAFIIETSETYMLNGERQWIKVNLTGGSGEITYDEVIYDGNRGIDEIIYDGGKV